MGNDMTLALMRRLLLLGIVVGMYFISSVDLKFENCEFEKVKFSPELEVLTYGKPTAFVTTQSVGVSPYSLIDPFRQSGLYHEYLLIGPGIANYEPELLQNPSAEQGDEEEEIQLILYDIDEIQEWVNDPNLVQQNLAKERLWSLINATGMLPSMTIVNTTFEKTFRFHTDEGDKVAYHLPYPNLFRSRETVPPLDVIIEFPAKTRMFQSVKTMIDYQTCRCQPSWHESYYHYHRYFQGVYMKLHYHGNSKCNVEWAKVGLLRWRLTPAEPVKWSDFNFTNLELPVSLEDPSLCGKPLPSEKDMDNDDYLRCVYAKRFKRIENPCIKDMIILIFKAGVRGVESDIDSYFAVNRMYMAIPMVYEVLSYQGWIDLTEAYCPRPDLSEECGNPLDAVLTNDHLLILSDRGLWVSNSLNESNVNVSFPYSMKPLLKFTPIDPCAQFDYFNCSEVGAPVLARQTVRQQRLFYTPVCHLFQYPIYEDMVMLVIDHVSQTDDLSNERDVFTVLYAAKPYNDWKILFHARYEYLARDYVFSIAELVSIFFNHHRRHFDITLMLKNKDGVEQLVRFALPLPTSPDFKGYEKLSGLVGNGFLEFMFPPSFHMTQVFVNPEPLDAFFVGNQIWIAEAAGAFVYISVPFISSPTHGNTGIISTCSFNHPDRSFLCVDKSHTVLYPGRIGVTYTVSSILFIDVNELRFTMLYNLWPVPYLRYISLFGNFVAGYSGKIMLWYLDDHNDLVLAQQKHVAYYKDDSLCNVGASLFPVLCHICRRLISRVTKSNCAIVEVPEAVPRFKMLSIDSTKLKGRNAVTDGPLIPFLIDGDKVVLFEASIPQLSDSKPVRDYFLEVDVGQRIVCTEREPEIILSSQPKPGSSDKDKDKREIIMETGRMQVQKAKRQLATVTTTTNPIDPDPGSQNPKDVTCPSINRGVPKTNCELFIRHTKRLERDGHQIFLEGFRRVLFATVIDSFPLRPIPTDMVILVLPNSNQAIIQLNTAMFEIDKEFTFNYTDIGQTLYVPEQFSVFLQGFPRFKSCPSPDITLEHDMTRMVGLTTRFYRQGARIALRPFKAFLIDFVTPTYCNWHRKVLQTLNTTSCVEDPYPTDVISREYKKRREEMNLKRNLDHAYRSRMSDALNLYYRDSLNSYEAGSGSNGSMFSSLKALTPAKYQDVEDLLLNYGEPAVGDLGARKLQMNFTQNPDYFSPKHFINFRQCRQSAWKIEDGGCHLQLYLSKNPVLKQSGGRISLDKFDFISFQVKLKSLTPLGRSLIHRPLIAVTNSNPTVLTVEHSEGSEKDIQIMNITLSPAGFKTGVATLSIRPLIVSSECLFAEGSFTLIVQVHRVQGRRLHVNYPIPTCKPNPDDAEYERPWKIDLPSCVTKSELLSMSEVRRPDDEIGTVFYSELPVNYRPPSQRGSEIPLSKYVYNVDPAKPWYKEKYRISKETGALNRCDGKITKDECECGVNDILSADIKFTDCIRMVYTAKRGFRVDINVEYDRIMRDQDQHPNFFTPKQNWSVFLEEINGRVEYTLSSQDSPYLELINNRPNLHQGRKYYDAKTLGVTPHGTGLFHFKVILGSFESFDEVSGFFMIFVPDNELNHLQLVVIMLLTITICMVFVFCGFLLVRQRLCSQLPFQAQHMEKQKLE